ncbi:MAG: hypothetical protein ACRDL8_23440 [Solirubrobacteraceae bacterium]
MEIEVQASSEVHATVSEVVLLRVGDEDRGLTHAQRQELTCDKGQATYETSPLLDATVAEIDRPLASSDAAALGRPDSARLLQARGPRTSKRHRTVAGALPLA